VAALAASAACRPPRVAISATCRPTRSASSADRLSYWPLARLNRHVLAIDLAFFVEAAAERGHKTREGIGRPAVENRDHGHRRLLSPRCERPRNTRAAKRG
jgi:hypothetical protein